jgi:hypothetical protein
MMTETKTTVAELIEKLKEFDGDTMVIVKCSMSGFNNCTIIKKIKIEPNVFGHWHQKSCNDKGIDAILLDFNK